MMADWQMGGVLDFKYYVSYRLKTSCKEPS